MICPSVHKRWPFPLEEQAQGFGCSNALFPTSSDVAADTAEGFRPLQGAETSRHLLLHLDHPQVVFRLVVGKGHQRITQEAENVTLKILQSLQQVSGF